MKCLKPLKQLITLFLLAGSCLGCAPKTESAYRVLSLFFDGVPKPQELTSKEHPEEAVPGKEASGEIRKTMYREHGPYAAKMCDGCHEPSTNVLVAPIDQLCFRCHEFRTDKKYVHGPLASGGCRVCHDPHGSKYRFLLVSEAETFCLYCHDKQLIETSAVHKQTQERCTSCHNAHMSDKRYLLK
jgi:predicted CXXCH cytochrome family protein